MKNSWLIFFIQNISIKDFSLQQKRILSLGINQSIILRRFIVVRLQEFPVLNYLPFFFILLNHVQFSETAQRSACNFLGNIFPIGLTLPLSQGCLSKVTLLAQCSRQDQNSCLSVSNLIQLRHLGKRLVQHLSNVFYHKEFNLFTNNLYSCKILFTELPSESLLA